MKFIHIFYSLSITISSGLRRRKIPRIENFSLNKNVTLFTNTQVDVPEDIQLQDFLLSNETKYILHDQAFFCLDQPTPAELSSFSHSNVAS